MRPAASRTRPMATAAVLAVLLAALPACDDDAGTGPEPTGTVVLELDHVVGDPADASSTVPLAFDSMDYVNAAGDPYSVTTLLYIVSELELHPVDGLRHDGVDYAWDAPHLRDGRDDATRTITMTDVPVGTYERLELTFGLDEERNCFVTDASCPGAGYVPDEAAFNNMKWPDPLGNGYHYMKLEGNYENDAAQIVGYTTHTGHNRNPTSGQIDDHSIRVSLDLGAAGVEVTDGGTVTIRLVMDINRWYQDPHLYELDDHGMIMPEWDTQVLLSANGANVWSVAEIR